MTATAAPGSGAATLAAPVQTAADGEGNSAGKSEVKAAKALWRKRPRWVAPMVVVAILMLVAISLTLLSPDDRGSSDDLDPANPGYTGAQGLARTLTRHGVHVTVVRTQRELLDQNVDAATTVVITNTPRLSGRTARTAREHAGPAAALVLLNPDAEVTQGMGLPVTPHPTEMGDVIAKCQTSLVGDDFKLSQAERAYTLTGDATGIGSGDVLGSRPNVSEPTTCFPDKSDDGGVMVSLPAAEPGDAPLTLLGDDSLITNGLILDADNAAIALRLFGQTNQLIWYIPSLADVSAADGTSRSIAPKWFKPGLYLGISAFFFLCIWRGRRLGRLVSEPLPVIVRAAETTESRGRMYRKSRDRTRALAILQLATRRRLAAYLGLSATTGVTNVAAAAAAVSGRTYQDVLELLSAIAAHDDSSLLAFANDLTELEKEVRRT